MESQALIFIPDISGYTKFITETETKHSKHIITELLEVIIKADKLKMHVSEIEGDAVLFYRKGDPPKLGELISQAKNMFLDFHTHLKIIQRDNVCQCGACRSAVNLTLKFVSHFGTLEEVTIQNFSKIMGSDVILAHRLLKNNIDDDEYLLITEDYLITQNNSDAGLDEWVKFHEHKESFKNFKEVQIKYVPLTEVKKELPDISKYKKSDFYYTNPDISIFIDAPILLVHELLTDNDAKLNYVPGLKEIKDNAPVNRINTSHTCVFDDLEIHFVTQSNEVKEKEISYVEQGEASIGVAFISDYKLKEEGKGTKLSLKIFPGRISKNLSFYKRVFYIIMTKLAISKLRKASAKNLETFKAYCEKTASERSD
ncbi:MAG: DUF2652 domain-containing protein [Bacteroidetes bacterium]|nr:DUF2652 domain-containing protein [Bacteroidota bacterium]